MDRKNNTVIKRHRADSSPTRRRTRNTLVQPKRRFSGKYLTLAIMGGAVFFAIKGCSDEADNDGDGVFYASISECTDDGNSAEVCVGAWNNAEEQLKATLPKNLDQANCQIQFGNCFYDDVERSWVPLMAGFLLNRSLRKDRDEHYAYSSGGGSYASRAVWRTSSGDYNWHSGSGKNDDLSHHHSVTKKVATVSRGGYGHSSSARGTWGG